MPSLIDSQIPFLPVPLETIPLDEALAFPLFVRIGERFVEFRAVKDTLTAVRLVKLREKLDCVYVSSAYWLRYLEMLEKKYKTGSDSPAVQMDHIHGLMLGYEKNLEYSQEDQKGAVAKLRNLSNEVGSIGFESPVHITRLIKRYRESGIYFTAHSTNVSAYSVAIAQKLGYSVDELKYIGFGCLVHNIGNSLLSEEILYKPERLNEDEFKTVQKHPIQGSQLLEYLNCPTEIVLMAKQHHERADGKGYPYAIGLDEIHPFSRICSIADCFDALTSHRPYATPVSGSGAIRLMQTMDGKFDPKILKMLGDAA